MNAPNGTELVYLHDSSATTHTTAVSSIFPLSSLTDSGNLKNLDAESCPLVLTTPSTVFYVRGGGQDSDTGIISSNQPATSGQPPPVFHVSTVRYGPNGMVYHLGRFEPGTLSVPAEFSQSSPITQQINGATRLLHSRIHDAGHILSLAILDLVSKDQIPGPVVDSKAQHYPSAAYVEFVGLIDGKYKYAIQRRVDQMVEKNLQVEALFLDPAEAAKRCVNGLEGAKELPQGEKLRVVDIVGAGAYPCGGTHVPSTAHVGKIKVRNIKRQKGVSKVSYEVI